jgi:spore germination protein
LATGGKNWWNYSLDRSIDEYLAGGVPPAKLLLGVSYYGAEWVTESLKTPSEALKFIRYLPYRDIKKVPQVGFAQPKEDAEGMSNFHVYRDNNNNYRQIWYDDSLALSKKYDFVISKKLAGVGIWALGYDNGYPHLWQALANKFAVPEEKPKSIANANMISRFMSSASTIARNPSSILKSSGAIFSLLAIFFGAGIGVYMMIYRYGCQWSRAFNMILKSGVALMIVCFLCLVLLLFKFFSAETALWAMGAFLLGIIVFLLMTRNYLSERELP